MTLLSFFIEVQLMVIAVMFALVHMLVGMIVLVSDHQLLLHCSFPSKIWACSSHQDADYLVSIREN